MTLRLSVSAVAATLAACSSMSSQVKDYSVDYGTAMAQFQNQQVLTNILRARDQQPLHFSELGQVNGSLQEQVQVGATIPFGKYVGAVPATNSLAPQVQFTSSPTFTTSPLDTQAFTVGLMQPIDATYLVDRWRAADSQTKELLLLLFVESIENADVSAVPSSNPDLRGPARLRNTPGDQREFRKFREYINILAAHADFRLITVMTPIGKTFTFDPKGETGYKLTEVVPLIDETGIHIRPADETHQLWRMWSNQLAICYGPPDGKKRPPAVPTSCTNESSAAETRELGFTVYRDVLRGQIGGGKNTAGGSSQSNNASSTAGANKPGGGAGTPAGAVATPVMPLVGFVNYNLCFSALYICPKDNNGEREFQISLRSVRSAIDYLGALIASDNSEIRAQAASIFSLVPLTADNKSEALITTSYKGSTYIVTDKRSSQVVTIISELVDSLKLSSDIATTKQVQVIP